MRAPDPATGFPLRLDGVSLRTGGVTILDGVTLEIAAGAPTVLIGPNGSGKTTLLRLMMGLLAPSEGRMIWNGVAPRAAIVFQTPVMLRRSVAGNIRYAMRAAGVPRAEHEARLNELLALVGLNGFGDRPARRLSGGERQRLALARALAGDPALLLLDEPTASLDPAATKAVEDIIALVAARGITVVMATHDLGEARRLAGDVVLLHRGRVIERGDAKLFFARPSTEAGRRFIAGELLI